MSEDYWENRALIAETNVARLKRELDEARNLAAYHEQRTKDERANRHAVPICPGCQSVMVCTQCTHDAFDAATFKEEK